MPSILLEAESIVNGPEQDNRKYGPPREVFQRYADIFNLICPTHTQLTAMDIAYVMYSVKLGRESYHQKRDNRVDACGYKEIINKLTEV